jgi:hypothetical protein
MAVAFDAATESHASTLTATSGTSYTWTHTPVGTPRGVLVFTHNFASATNTNTAVTYGGVSMTAVTGGEAQDTAGTFPLNCKAWFLGSGIPTGAQSVVVSRSGGSCYATAVTVTAGADTETHGVVLLQEDGTLSEQSVTDGSTGVDSVRFAAAIWGDGAVPVVGANSTLLQSIDVGTRTARTVRETTAGQGSRSVGFTEASPFDRAAVHLAVREVSGGGGSNQPPRSMHQFRMRRVA